MQSEPRRAEVGARGVAHRVLGLLHRVLGAPHRVLGVRHNVLGVLEAVDRFHEAKGRSSRRGPLCPDWRCPTLSRKSRSVPIPSGGRWTHPKPVGARTTRGASRTAECAAASCGPAVRFGTRPGASPKVGPGTESRSGASRTPVGAPNGSRTRIRCPTEFGPGPNASPGPLRFRVQIEFCRRIGARGQRPIVDPRQNPRPRAMPLPQSGGHARRVSGVGILRRTRVGFHTVGTVRAKGTTSRPNRISAVRPGPSLGQDQPLHQRPS